MKNDYKILHGDALTVLKSMPAESVQCCITSPPYYGLRSYGTVPQVWGNHNGCDHAFGSSIPFAKQDNRTAEQKAEQGASVGSNINFNESTTTATSGNFCQSCNAWRGELGLEPTFQLYISHLIEIFAEVKRVLKKDGTCYVNLGDSYCGSGPKINNNGSSGTLGHRYAPTLKSKVRGMALPANKSNVPAKSLMNIPARFTIAMTDKLQFIQRNEIIWHKPACMPSSAKDRYTVDFEPIFFYAKNGKYKFNQQLEKYTKPLDRWGGDKLVANGEGCWDKGTGQETYRDRDMRPNPEGRNKRTTWKVNFEPSSDAHYASYPTKLIEPMILSGTDEGDTVLDIFNGTATTGLVALRNRRKYIGIELNEDYIKITKKRLSEVQVKLF